MAIGGSTNAVLHLLAIAHAAGVPLALDDFETIRARVPVLCDLKPSGRFVTTDFHRAGGVPQVMRMLLDHGLLHGDALTITGKTVAETLAGVPAEPPAGQDVIRPWTKPLYAQGHLAILRGNLATEGAVAKVTGVKHPVMTGPARVFDSEEACIKAIFGRQIRPGDVVIIRYEGPKGGPGMREMLSPTSAIIGAGPRRLGRPDHRRPLLGRDLRAGGRPRGPRGGGRRHDRPRARGRPGHDRRGRSACCSSRWTRPRSPAAGPPGRRPRPATRAACSRSTRASWAARRAAP